MDPHAKSALATAVAVALHGFIAGGLSSVDAEALLARAQLVELEIREEPRPPPPDLKPEPTPAPKPEPTPEPKPRIVPRKLALAEAKPPPAPPPPNQEPPPNANAAPPVFGVTMSSTVAGDAAMAVPVGNTLMTKDRTRAKTAELPQAYPSEGTRPFQPVAEVYISQMPVVLHEIKADGLWPPEALRMGLEGRVKLRVGIDDQGDVVEVKVVSRAGYGFDEAATKALRKFKFSPARTSDGRSVPCRITYAYTFEQPR